MEPTPITAAKSHKPKMPKLEGPPVAVTFDKEYGFEFWADVEMAQTHSLIFKNHFIAIPEWVVGAEEEE